MKSLKIYLATGVFLLSFSCVAPPRRPKPPKNPKHNGAKPLPPGQAKKIFGTKSAKPFAPGQRKQSNKNNDSKFPRCLTPWEFFFKTMLNF